MPTESDKRRAPDGLNQHEFKPVDSYWSWLHEAPTTIVLRCGEPGDSELLLAGSYPSAPGSLPLPSHVL